MIHINADIGEIPAHITDGTQEALLPYLTAVNIACACTAACSRGMRRIHKGMATLSKALNSGSK